MSEIAGRMSVQIGAHYLERRKGVGFLAGVPGVEPGKVVVLGAGWWVARRLGLLSGWGLR